MQRIYITSRNAIFLTMSVAGRSGWFRGKSDFLHILQGRRCSRFGSWWTAGYDFMRGRRLGGFIHHGVNIVLR
jgi:hypothetical protein